jgi:phosphoserine phosphatase
MMPLAIFDLDDTLIDGDSASLWLRYLVQQGWAEAFVSSMIPPRVFPAARRQMDWHRQQGNQLLIISATAGFIVRRIALWCGRRDRYRT